MYTGIKRPECEADPFVHQLLLMSPWRVQGQLTVGRVEEVCHGVTYVPCDVSNQYSTLCREAACTDEVLVLLSRIVTQCGAVRVTRTGSPQFAVQLPVQCRTLDHGNPCHILPISLYFDRRTV